MNKNYFKTMTTHPANAPMIFFGKILTKEHNIYQKEVNSKRKSRGYQVLWLRHNSPLNTWEYFVPKCVLPEKL